MPIKRPTKAKELDKFVWKAGDIEIVKKGKEKKERKIKIDRKLKVPLKRGLKPGSVSIKKEKDYDIVTIHDVEEPYTFKTKLSKEERKKLLEANKKVNKK